MSKEMDVSAPNFAVETAAKTGPSIRRGKSKQDYGTPRDFIAAVERRFGTLNLDVAASAENAKAPEFWTVVDDALSKNWALALNHWHAWLNPPYDDIEPWAARAAQAWRRGEFLHMLVPASIGSRWFENLVKPYAYVEGLSPRITFDGCDDPYPKDLMLCTYGYGLTGFGTWRWRA